MCIRDRFGDFNDPDAYTAAAKRGAAIGIEGKWAIHPSQIELANKVFSPPEAEVNKAKRIIEELNKAHPEYGIITEESGIINKSNTEVIETIITEVKKYTGALKVNFIQHYIIKQALPDIQNLKMTLQPGENQLMDNIFLAGDALMNGSLNAAMESGRIAAKSLLEKRKD